MSAPVTPVPAATIVLMRDGESGLEVLLLRRSSRAGFVPGAFVFPGGLVDAEDAAPAALARIEGITPEAAAARLGLVGTDPPAIAYYVAAVREAFEETGLLVGSRAGSAPPESEAAELADTVRLDLLERRISFADALVRLGLRVTLAGIEYFAHWITPERAPRRYDTRFFAARVGAEAEPVVDGREMTDALWITPEEGVRKASDGSLPMIRPTVHTLERLSAFRETDAVLASFAVAPVPTILPAAGPGGFAGPLAEARLPGS